MIGFDIFVSCYPYYARKLNHNTSFLLYGLVIEIKVFNNWIINNYDVLTLLEMEKLFKPDEFRFLYMVGYNKQLQLWDSHAIKVYRILIENILFSALSDMYRLLNGHF